MRERQKAVTLKGFAGVIEFRDVCFGYERDGDTKQVLHNISSRCGAARWWRLWGQAAPGKSTLVNLLPRFFDVTRGCHPA